MKVGINDLSVKIYEMCMLALKKIFFFSFNNILGKRLAQNICVHMYTEGIVMNSILGEANIQPNSFVIILNL